MSRFPRRLLGLFAALSLLLATGARGAGGTNDPLPSWSNGPAKDAIVAFVQATTDPDSPDFVPEKERLATFDQDGTTWVEQPIYTEIRFSLDRLKELAPQHPEWSSTEPFKSALSGDAVAIARLSNADFEKIYLATHAGPTVEEFQRLAAAWLGAAKDKRWGRHYTELVYQPMLEVMRYLRSNGYRTDIVTGGGQDFVRSYADQVYSIPPSQIIGTAVETKYAYDETGKNVLMLEPKPLLDNNFSGKAQDIYLFTGQRPRAAFGNSTGDRQMLEFTQGGRGKRLEMLVLHDDSKREYAYGPALGLPDSKVGTFPQALYDEARLNGWTVISMKRDWKRIFPFEALP